MDEVVSILEKFGAPFSYDHFAEGEGPEPPFVCYRTTGSANFSADGCVYLRIDVVDIELYTDRKDPERERKLERLLDAAGIFYDKEEVWIDSEKLYEVIYEFQMEVNYGGEEE